MFEKIKDGPKIEVRYVVAMLDTDIFKCPARKIVQGYLQSTILSYLCVRIIDGKRAVFGRKSGKGLNREEQEWEIPLWLGYLLLGLCRGRVLRKKRYERDGWEVDEFEKPLKGLVIAEKEVKSADESIEPPSWMCVYKDVTSWLTNQELACLARELRKNPLLPGEHSIREYVCERFMPREYD